VGVDGNRRVWEDGREKRKERKKKERTNEREGVAGIWGEEEAPSNQSINQASKQPANSLSLSLF